MKSVAQFISDQGTHPSYQHLEINDKINVDFKLRKNRENRGSMDNTVTFERRLHKRFRVPNDTIAIAVEGLGNVIEISKGGMSGKFINYDFAAIDFWKADILLRNKFHLKNIPMQIKWKTGVQRSKYGIITSKTVGLEFGHLTEPQRSQLDMVLIRLEEGYY